jgi:hypothetical protein
MLLFLRVEKLVLRVNGEDQLQIVMGVFRTFKGNFEPAWAQGEQLKSRWEFGSLEAVSI